ncbi:MAG: glycoside hydrolase family 3 protein, partial [Rhizobacter sp.]
SLDAGTAEFLRANHVRAACLFRQNMVDAAQLTRFTSSLREAMGPQALIALDQEGGAVVRSTWVPAPPAAMTLGAADDPGLARAVGAAVARAVKALGFNWNFAPVLDLNNNPHNPVIAERSFGADPKRATEIAMAWMAGSESEGVACCVKHFPGHGDTHVDSHRDLPVVDKSLDELRALELLPFAALKDEAPAMMTAHIVYPQLDTEHPATLSRRILGGLLREEMGYDGVVITDSLVMNAIHERYGHHRAAVLTLAAGADMAMALGSQADQGAALQSIAAAQADGTLPRRRLAEACARLDALARRFPSQAAHYPQPVRAHDDVLMRQAWAAGLTLVGDAHRPRRDDPLRVFTQDGVPSDGVSEAGLAGDDVARLFAGFGDVEVVRVSDLRQLDWARVPRDGRRTLLASNHRERYDPRSRGWRPDLHLALWNPFQVFDVSAPAVVTWGYAPGALDALRAWLEGRGDAPGRSPVRLARAP